jgi:DNA-binding NarL/FixJ family response regulator
MMLLNQGFAALMSRRLRNAKQHFIEGLTIAQQLDDRIAQCYLVGGLACCAAGSAEPRLAAQLLGAMETLRSEVGAAINAAMSAAVTHATTAATSALGTRTFATEFEAGRQGRTDAWRLTLGQSARDVVAASGRDPAEILRQRETEVAVLVAQGLRNKEIGARLFISERTVESHVRNILNKLGFSSRAQIAGWISTPGQ